MCGVSTSGSTIPGMFREKRDNLLVETFFCHFRGLILCNAKRLRFHREGGGGEEHKGTVQQVFYPHMPSCFKIDGVVASFHVAQNNFLFETAPLSY